MKTKTKPFSIRERINSFQYAVNGIQTLLKEEHNSRIHFAAALMAILLGVLLKISTVEWSLISIAITGVFAMELINSAIENLADAFSIEKDDRIMKVKDMAAGAVLVAAVGALIIGILIFLPKLITLVSA